MGAGDKCILSKIIPHISLNYIFKLHKDKKNSHVPDKSGKYSQCKDKRTWLNILSDEEKINESLHNKRTDFSLLRS